MNRRHFIKLFGVSTVAVAVGSQLPAVAAPAPLPIPAPVPNMDDVVNQFHELVERDMVTRLKSGNLHGNPYAVTKADIGMCTAEDLIANRVLARRA